MDKSESAFYGAGPDGSKSSAGILLGGEQGELTLIGTPTFQTLVRQTERILTGQKPAFKAVAQNSDSKTVAQVLLADQLISAYDRRLGLELREAEAVRAGILHGSGWIVLEWATQEGEAIGANPDTGRVIKEGDVRACFLSVRDVACDFKAHDAESREWVVFRRRANKFKLAAQYPKQAEDIKAMTLTKQDGAIPTDKDWRDSRDWREDEKDEDFVWLWEVRHTKAAQLQPGRLVRFLTPEVVLFDSAQAGYPYPDLCAYEYAPETRLGSAVGHSAHFDLLAIQETLDLIATIATSNVNAGGVVNFWTLPGPVPGLQALSTGMNIIQSASKPEVLDMVRISPEMMGLFEMFKGLAREAVGVNDVVSGDIPKGMPAQLAALLEAKAAQYHQAGQRGYYRLVENVRTGVLKLLQRFATSRRVVELVGASQSWALKEFSQADIGDVARVTVEPVNAIMRTFAGRMTRAEYEAEKGWIGKDEYEEIVDTGQSFSKDDPRKAWRGRIAQEKEMLVQGIGLPPVNVEASLLAGSPVFEDTGEGNYIRPLLTDRHWLDIPEYLGLLESPDARSNPEVTQAVLDLVTHKLTLWQQMPPDILALLGGPPAPSSMAAMMAQPPLKEGKKAKASPGEAAAPPSMAQPDIRPPAPPPNPETGEQDAAPVQTSVM